MGDLRFDAAYRVLARAPDTGAAIRALNDEDLVHALAAASRRMDAYLANVLAVELLNRRRRQRALVMATVVALGVIVLLRSILLVLTSTAGVILWSLLTFLPAGLAGYGAYRLSLRSPPR